MSKGKNSSGLGRAIINSKIKLSRNNQLSNLYTTELDGPSKLKSVTQENDLDEFLNTARLAGTDFAAEKQNLTIVQSASERSSAHNRFLLSPQEEADTLRRHAQNRERLRIPRRPPWKKSMSLEELERSERDAFLEWRRQLAQLHDSDEFILTPFERNLEVWRQLWRVIERSDLLVQIVDARNPLHFFCEDLDSYVRDLSPSDHVQQSTPRRIRKTLLLINKADLLTSSQRREWADYFDANHLVYAFYSALKAFISQDVTSQIYQSQEVEVDASQHQTLVNGFEENLAENQQEGEGAESDACFDLNETNDGTGDDPRIRVLSVTELESFLKDACPIPLDSSSSLTVGFVGYPNVGKSSTINSLVGAKKVSVSSTPGKTKHFQTIHLSHDLIICDCPGLVFPQFALTKAELVCNGVLPIDQLREYIGPVSLVVQRIPRDILELTYGLSIPGSQSLVTAESLLTAYAIARGFARSGQGNPDESRAARYVLKDFVNAKLLYCHPPPGTSSEAFNSQSNGIILTSLTTLKKKRAPITRVPQTADTYVTSQSSQNRSNESNGTHGSMVVDNLFFNPETSLSSRPFVQGSNLHGQQFSRSQAFPHQRISADDGSLLGERTWSTLDQIQRVSHRMEPVGKKHYKGMKRAKQRSGKGYE